MEPFKNVSKYIVFHQKSMQISKIIILNLKNCVAANFQPNREWLQFWDFWLLRSSLVDFLDSLTVISLGTNFQPNREWLQFWDFWLFRSSSVDFL